MVYDSVNQYWQTNLKIHGEKNRAKNRTLSVQEEKQNNDYIYTLYISFIQDT